MSENRLVLIGLDSATFDLLGDWIDEDRLPALRKIKERGVWGPLGSSIHPISPVAWTSILTGMNPGEHGIYDFQKRIDGKYKFRMLDSTDINFLTLPELLDRKEIDTGTVNLPMTYPPFQLENGFVVSGMLSGSDLFHPSSLKKEVEDKFGEYKLLPKVTYSGNNEDEHLKSIFDVLAYRIKVLRYLIKVKNFSFFMANFQVVDQIQHWYWKYLGKDKKYGDKVLELFKEIDSFLEELLELEDTNLLIISDHGMGEMEGSFYVNNWLKEEGFLKLKRDPKTLLKRALHKAGLTVQNLYKISSKLGLMEKGKEMERESRDELLDTLTLSFDDVDWERTQAFSSGHMGQIYINTKDDFEQGCVSQEDYESVVQKIINRLKEVEDPKTGEKIIKNIKKGGEIYHGERAAEAPDIIFNVGGYSYSTTVNFFEFGSNEIFGENITMKSGEHRPEGILLAKGPDIRKDSGKIEGMEIVDLAPTVLHYFNSAVPDKCDGKVLEEMFSEDSDMRKRAIEEKSTRRRERSSYERKGEDIRERLKKLGYMK